MRTTVVLPAGLLSLANTASAWEPELINLRNGGVVRGDLVEKVPSDHVTLKLATGELRVIPWQDIQQSPAPVAPTIQASPAAPLKVGPPPLVAGREVHIVFKSDVGARLECLDTGGVVVDRARSRALMSSGGRFTSICENSCDTTATADAQYRVSSASTHYVKPFRLEPGDATVDLQAAEDGKYSAGAIMLALGISAIASGGIAVGLAYLTATTSYDVVGSVTTATSTPVSGLLIGGLVTGGIGLILAGIGVPLLITNHAARRSTNGASSQ